MKHLFGFAVAILLTLSVPYLSTAQDTVTVAKVIDGRTFTTTSGLTIVLLGVDLPRKKQAIDPGDAQEQLQKTIGGQQVVLVADTLSSQKAAKGNTLPRYVYHGEQLVNLFMIYYGYGNVASKPNHALLKEFKDAEAAARAKQMGAWAKERSSATRCTATTQKGTQCKRMTTNLSGKCWQHE